MPIPNVNDNVNDNGDDSIQSIKDKIAENDKMINTLEKMLKSKRLNGLGDSNSNMKSSTLLFPYTYTNGCCCSSCAKLCSV